MAKIMVIDGHPFSQKSDLHDTLYEVNYLARPDLTIVHDVIKTISDVMNNSTTLLVLKSRCRL